MRFPNIAGDRERLTSSCWFFGRRSFVIYGRSYEPFRSRASARAPRRYLSPLKIFGYLPTPHPRAFLSSVLRTSVADFSYIFCVVYQKCWRNKSFGIVCVRGPFLPTYQEVDLCSPRLRHHSVPPQNYASSCVWICKKTQRGLPRPYRLQVRL